MPDHPLVKVAKIFGWGLLGEKLGVPMAETAVSFTQALQQAQREIQYLRQKLVQLALSYLKIWSEKQELQQEVSRLQQENDWLRSQIEELEAQVAAQSQPLPEPRKGAPSELSASQWFKIMPEFARGLILGAPGSGKSATGHMLLELYRWKMTPYVLGFPEEKKALLPEWIGLARHFDEVPPDSIVLVDEAYLLYHARKSSFDESIQEMSRALGLARQRGYSILFVAHEARHLDKNIVGYANLFLVKEPGAMEVKFERPELKEVLKRARDFFQERTGDKRGWCYVWSPEVHFEGPLETPLPSYWSEELSRAYSQGISSPAQRPPSASKEEKKRQAKAWRDAGLSYGKIAKRLGVSKATVINWLKHGG